MIAKNTNDVKIESMSKLFPADRAEFEQFEQQANVDPQNRMMDTSLRGEEYSQLQMRQYPTMSHTSHLSKRRQIKLFSQQQRATD
jgi:hypothetical protein